MKCVRNTASVIALAFALAAQTATEPSEVIFEGQPAITATNGKIQAAILEQGATLASIVLTDDPEQLNPLWNPDRLVRESGGRPQAPGMRGHFAAVDGFGPPSASERAAGFPPNGEAHLLPFVTTFRKDGGTASVNLTARLPIVEEYFTRIYRLVDGENVVYVDSELENPLGFDRPISWTEDATVAAPFMAPGFTVFDISGSRSQTRPAAMNGEESQPMESRLIPGQDFTWPSAPGTNGRTINMRASPGNPRYFDRAATLLDPSRDLEFATALNTFKELLYGYVFRRRDYPWIQHWGYYPSEHAEVRGMQFGTQPYDLSRRENMALGELFDTPVYRWLPAKSKIETHFLLFITRVPDGFRKVDEVALADGRLVIEDRTAQKRIVLPASRGLPLEP